jgi:hypothetical protein
MYLFKSNRYLLNRLGGARAVDSTRAVMAPSITAYAYVRMAYAMEVLGAPLVFFKKIVVKAGGLFRARLQKIHSL